MSDEKITRCPDCDLALAGGEVIITHNDDGSHTFKPLVAGWYRGVEPPQPALSAVVPIGWL